MKVPLTFDPYFRPQVWGGRRLQSVLGKRLPAEGQFGESWELSSQPLHVSRVSQGPMAGRTLNELWPELVRNWLPGPHSAGDQFPLLVKWLDCSELLSVQVHPNDEQARRLLGEPRGKTEAWVIVHAEPDARVYAGLRQGVDRAAFERALKQGTVADLLHSFVPQRGDVVFIPAGTVHAAGGGIVMAEVQQTSDATFRLFDWNRLGPDGQPRTLHQGEALECIDWNQGPVNAVTRISLDPDGAAVAGEPFLKTPYFELSLCGLRPGTTLTASGEAKIAIVLSGDVELRTAEGRSDLPMGTTCLLPPGKGGWELRAEEAGTAQCLIVDFPTAMR